MNILVLIMALIALPFTIRLYLALCVATRAVWDRKDPTL